MSIYSGFATRQQQQYYDTYTQRLLNLLQTLTLQLLSSYSLPPPSKFCSSFIKTIHHMKKMEQYKYLKPKLTETLQPLLKVCSAHSLPVETKTKNAVMDNSYNSHNISSRLDIEMERPSLTANQKDLMEEYEVEASKRSSSFRLGRPLTTKFTSVTKSKSSASTSKRKYYKGEDEDFRDVVEQYLGGAMKAGLAKAQKHYLKAYKRHQKEYVDPFNNTNLFRNNT